MTFARTVALSGQTTLFWLLMDAKNVENRLCSETDEGFGVGM